jgi:hypothetical protein
MNGICTYLIQLRGQLDEGEINPMSPLQMTVVQADTSATLLTVCSDQCGLIGLMRHLHGLGFVLVSVRRVDADGSVTDKYSSCHS